MPSTNIYLNGFLDIDGRNLWAEDIDLEVEYDIEREDMGSVVEYEVVGISGPIYATDDHNNCVVLNIAADHPAIRALVSRSSHRIEDACIDDASFQ